MKKLILKHHNYSTVIELIRFGGLKKEPSNKGGFNSQVFNINTKQKDVKKLTNFQKFVNYPP